MNTEEKLKLATTAINAVLIRIRDDANIKYHMGAMTGAYEKLKAAHCAISGRTPEECDEVCLAPAIMNGREQKPDAPVLDAVKSAFQDFVIHERRGAGSTNAASLIEQLREILPS